MYKVIYDKETKKVVSVIPFNYVNKEVTTTNENDEEVTETIKESDTQFYYNEAQCDSVELDTIPTITSSQYLIYANKKLVVNTDKIALISELKNKLLATDYKAIKYAEGEISAEDYAEIKAQRRAWRAEINELEEE